jgi:hypothetical protein
MTQEAEFTIQAQKDAEVVVAAHRNVSIIAWVGAATAQGVELMSATAPARFEAYPQGLSIVHVVTEHAEMPSGGARDALIRQARQYGERVSVVSVIIERSGFAASALRGAVTGVMMVAPGMFARRVHGSIFEAAIWFPATHASRTRVTLDSTRFRETVEAVRNYAIATRSAGSHAPRGGAAAHRDAAGGR